MDQKIEAVLTGVRQWTRRVELGGSIDSEEREGGGGIMAGEGGGVE